MFTQLNDGIRRFIAAIEQLEQEVHRYLGPSLAVGKIIAAIYSVYAVTVLVGCGILGHPMRWLTGYPGADLVVEILAMISILVLVLSGSIVEAFRILLYGLECGASLASFPSGSLISFSVSIVLFIIPLLIAVLVILFVPIIPILVHQQRVQSHQPPSEPPSGRLFGIYTRPMYSGSSPSAATTTSSGSRARFVSMWIMSSLPIRWSQAP